MSNRDQQKTDTNDNPETSHQQKNEQNKDNEEKIKATSNPLSDHKNDPKEAQTDGKKDLKNGNKAEKTGEGENKSDTHRAETNDSSGPKDPSDSISLSLSPQTARRTPANAYSPVASSPADSDRSIVTLESLKYLQILDQYVSGQHWDLDMEYILNSVSGVVWSLLITFFIFYDIDDKCWNRLNALLSLSVFISAFTAFELSAVSVVWYLSLYQHFANRSRICVIVLVLHIITAFSNLLMAIIDFGSRTCSEWGDLDSRRKHLILVLYEVKMIGLLHCIVSFNLMLCAMLLAIKRNDFKFYVLWRKGLLNQYLMLQDDD